ncbi:MAG: tetratricopeptide repeat protein [Brevinematia bacterium]
MKFLFVFLIILTSCGAKETGIKSDIKNNVEEYKKSAISSYMKGDTDTALNYLSQSLEMAYKVDSVKQIVEINNLVAEIYINSGDIISASNYIFNAYNIEKVEGRNFSFDTMLNIARLWMKLYEKTQSNFYLEKSKEAFNVAEKSIKSDEERARYYNNYGKLMLKIMNYEKALDFFLKALKLCENKKNFLVTADSYYNIGRVYEEKKSYEKAIENYKKSLENDKLVENTRGIYLNLKKIGTLYEKLGNTELSEYYLSKAKKISSLYKSEEF